MNSGRSPTIYSLSRKNMSSFPFCWDVKCHGTVVQDPASQKKMAKDRQSSEWWLRILGFANLTILSYIRITHRSTPQMWGHVYCLPMSLIFTPVWEPLNIIWGTAASTEAESNIFVLKLVWNGFEQAIWTISSQPGPSPNFTFWQSEKTKD